MDAILVKGAKNSSGSSTGDDPSGGDKLEYTVVAVPRFVINSNYGNISNYNEFPPELTSYELYIYDNTGTHFDKIYPYTEAIGIPYDDNPPFYGAGITKPSFYITNTSTGFDGSGWYCLANMINFDSWWATYQNPVKYIVAHLIEQKYTNLKLSNLHTDGTENTNIIFSTQYIFLDLGYGNNDIGLYDRNVYLLWPKESENKSRVYAWNLYKIVGKQITLKK